MFVLFIFALILLLVGAVMFFGALAEKDGGFTAGGVGILLLGVVLAFVSCIRTVGTKEIGVPTTFGKVGSAHYSAGFHVTSPWTSIHEMDGAIQTLDHLDNRCFQVRIANNQTGCAEVSIQWRINPAQVDYLYKNYRSFSHVEKQLVDRKLFSATNEALKSYNPLAAVGTRRAVANPLPGFQNDIFGAMKRKVSDINGKRLIEIINVQLPIVHFDPETQKRVNQLQQQVALTAIAKQREQTNKAEALANAALVRQKDGLSQLVLVSRCFDTLEQMVKSGVGVPPGFGCWPGGGQIPVIANASK